MKLNAFLKSLTFAGLLIESGVAIAQEQPTAPQDDKKVDSKEAKDTKDAKEEVTAAEKKNEFALRINNVRRDPRAVQYLHANSNTAVETLSLFFPASRLANYSNFFFHDAGGFDRRFGTKVAFAPGTWLSASRQTYGFYTLNWQALDQTTRDASDVTLSHAFTPQIVGFCDYKSTVRTDGFPAPLGNSNTRTRNYAVGASGAVAGGNASLTLSERQIMSGDGYAPRANQRSIQAGFEHSLGNRLDVEGSASRSTIYQGGLNNSAVNASALAANIDLGESGFLRLTFGQQDLNLPNVQNSYVRRRVNSGARLYQRLGKWKAQLGYEHSETERFRADHSYVDVPRTDRVSASLSGRLNRTSVSLKGTWEGLKNLAVDQTEDSRSLVFDRKMSFQAKLSQTNEKQSHYATYGYSFNQNRERSVRISWFNATVGSSFVMGPTTNGYVEFANDNYQVSSDSVEASTLGEFFTDSRSATAGINWTLNPKFSASASINVFDSNNVRGSQATLSCRRKLSEASQFEFMVSPWKRQDRLADATSYGATLLALRYSTRF